MATAPSIPVAATAGSPAAGAARSAMPAAAQPTVSAQPASAGESLALVPATQAPAEDADLLRGAVPRLPVEVDVVVPIPEFRVRDLLNLEPGRVIPSQWSCGEDLPLAAGEVRLAWSEFEVIDNQLGVRITRLR